MVKKAKKTLKSKSYNISNTKRKLNLIVIKNNKRKKNKKKLYDKSEYITDLSFIDKCEEDEKRRIKIKENENIIRIQNKKLFNLKICYRPTTNNIELIGNYLEGEENNNVNKIKNNKNNHNKYLLHNKCSYLLIRNNNIVVPILNEDILNIDNKNNDKNKVINNLNENEKKDNGNIQINNKKNRIKKTHLKYKNKQFFYIHICKKNIINFLLLNEYSIINYILSFLSGIYSGYFEESNKNNSLVLKVDTFNLFLYNHNSINNNDFSNIQILGKGKDEYGDYIIKGNMELIHNLEKYQNENENINKKDKDKVIYFGNLNFHKIYNI